MEDYYALMGLPAHYFIDEAALKGIYLQRSRDLHPDHHTQADPAHQAEMLRLSSLTNLAYRTLSQPHARLQYLLQRHGLLDHNGADLTATHLSPDFLMEMMELNEEIETATPDQKPALQARVSQLETDLTNDMHDLLRQHDTAPIAEQKPLLHSLMPIYLQRQYLFRLNEALAKIS